jgi:hypothetical protein
MTFKSPGIAIAPMSSSSRLREPFLHCPALRSNGHSKNLSNENSLELRKSSQRLTTSNALTAAGYRTRSGCKRRRHPARARLLGASNRATYTRTHVGYRWRSESAFPGKVGVGDTGRATTRSKKWVRTSRSPASASAQIEAKALRKLHHPSRSKQLKSFMES